MTESGWWLPGHGTPKETCGHTFWYRHLARPGEYHYREVVHHCLRFECPTCALEPGGWAWAESLRITERLNTAIAQKVCAFPKVVHVVVSPRAKVPTTTRAYQKMREGAYRALRRAGVEGGCLVFHHKRLGSPRFNAGEHFGCRDGPHFHALGFGWVDTGTPEWLVKNLGIRKSVRGTAFYLLSHASRPDPGVLRGGILPMPHLSAGTECVTWFGSCSYAKLKVPEDPEGGDEDGILCPTCGRNVPTRDWEEVVPLGWDPPKVAQVSFTRDHSSERWARSRMGVAYQ